MQLVARLVLCAAALIISRGPIIAHAQTTLLGTRGQNAAIVGYAVSQGSMLIELARSESALASRRSAYLIGDFADGGKEELIRVRRTGPDLFVFTVTTMKGEEQSRRIRLSREVGKRFYVMTGFDIGGDGSHDLAIIDVSERQYRWFIIENPMDESGREKITFQLGYQGDRIEWTKSARREVEFVAIRQSKSGERIRAIFRGAASGDTRVFRARWRRPKGSLIPVRLHSRYDNDPSLALYSPAKRSLVLFGSRGGGLISLAMPRQRCGGYQLVSGVTLSRDVLALELCGDGTYVVASRANQRASREDHVLLSKSLAGPLANLRRGDLTRIYEAVGEVPLSIPEPGSDGSVVFNPIIEPLPAILPDPSDTPSPTPTATPIVATVALVSPPSAVSTVRTLTSSVVGSNAAEWRYMFGQDGFDCGTQSAWSSWSSISTALSLDLGYPRQKVLCLQGRVDTTSDGGPIQEYRWDLAFEYNININAATNISLDAPLIQAVSDSSDARSKFSDGCIDYRGNSSVTLGSTIHFQTICHHPSAGWSLCLATWDGTAPSASWEDSAPATDGFQPHWSKCSKSSDNINFLGNLFKYSFTALSDGRVFGTFNGSGGGCGPRLAGSGFHPIVAPTISSMTSAHTLAGFHNWSQPIEAGTWRASYDRNGSWVNSDESGNIWVYNTSRDIAGRAYLSAIELDASNYTATVSAPSDYLVADYQSGMVRRKDSTYHFIGYHTVRQRWEHVLGRSPTDFDWDHPTNLGLTSILSTPGKWFSDSAVQAPTCPAGPYIHTFEVLTDASGSTNLFIFFRAGDLATQTATSSRGIGAIKIPLS